MPEYDDEHVPMWPYYRDKYGHKEALEGQYHKELAADIQLQMALAQLKNAEMLIDTLMEKKGT